MTYTWTIKELERNVADGGVVVAHYGVDLVDGEDTVGAYGTHSFTPDPTAEGFTAFEDLTEAMVIGWVKGGLGEDTVANIEAQLAAKLEEKRNPPVIAGKPWASE